MTLDQARVGQSARITRIPDPVERVKAIRLGISEGAVVTCQDVLPGGPVVIRKGLQEVAIGRRLARRILIEPDSAGGKRRARP